MGLVDQLGCAPKKPNAFQKLIGAVAGSKVGIAAMSPIVESVDRATLAVTGGRTTLTGIGSGQTVIWLSVTGRRSGEVRQVPLLAFPIGDDLGVIGSNFGRTEHPAWALNVAANPRIEVSFGDRKVGAVARHETDVERETFWAAANAAVPSYGRYREQVTNREIKMFVLEPEKPV